MTVSFLSILDSIINTSNKMATINIISNATFKGKEFKNKMGTLMFPSQFYDCTYYVDVPELQKALIANGFQLAKGAKILNVLTQTDEHPEYKNIQNKIVRYKTPLCGSTGMDGAFYHQSPRIPDLQYWALYHPVSDVTIVVSKV